MKTLKTVLCAITLVAVFVTSKADFVLTASGTAEIQKTFTIGSNTATTATLSFNNKYIYTLISNAVANVTNWSGTAIDPTNLPANGYIAYNPTANDTMVPGVFYVTNKSGVYYPLSGVDTNGQYYSWIELDSQNMFLGPQSPPRPPAINVRFFLGWNGDYTFKGITSFKLNSKTNGMETAKSTAVFYLHDNPYSYNDGENPDNVFSNENAVEVRGILTATLVMTSVNDTISSLSMTGSGNLMYNPNYTNTDTGGQLVNNATVKFGK